MSPQQTREVRLLAWGRDEGIKVERLRVLDILAVLAGQDCSSPVQRVLREIERRIYDVEAMP